jgi:hypothetical protein
MPTKKAIFIFSIRASDGAVAMNFTSGKAWRRGWVRKWKMGSRNPQQMMKPTTSAIRQWMSRVRSSSKCSRNDMESGLERGIGDRA